MGDVLATPLHLAVHVSGFGFAAGLAAYAAVRRDEFGGNWMATFVGSLLLAVSSLVMGGQWAQGLAWPWYLRAAGYAGLAYGFVGRPGFAAIAPAAPLASHLVAGITGVLAALASLGGVLGRGRDVMVLSAGIGVLALGDGVAGTVPALGEFLSLLGAVAGLAWLSQRTSRSLAYRFVTPFGAVLLLVILVLASASAVVFDQDLQAGRLDLLAQQVDTRVTAIQNDAADDLAATLGLAAEARNLPSRLRGGGAGDGTARDLGRVVTPADFILLAGPDGRVVGSFDRATGESMGPAATTLAGLPVVDDARQLRTATSDLVSIELVDGATDSPELLAVVAQPLFALAGTVERRDQPSGLVVAANLVGRSDRLDEIARQTGAGVALLAGGRVAATSAGDDPDLRRDLAALSDAEGGQVAPLAGRSSFIQVATLRNTDGDRIGAVVLFEDATVVAGVQRTVSRLLFLAAILGGLLATGLAAVVTSRATRPVRRLTHAAEQITAGDLSVHVDTDAVDEVGRLATVFTEMAAALRDREGQLQTAARREATVRERLESVTTSMNEGLLTIDADGTVGLANPAAARLLEVPLGQLVGRPFRQVLAGTTNSGQEWHIALGQVGLGEVRAARGRLRISARRQVAIAATAAPLVTDEGEPGRVVVLRDVTSETEIDRLKDEFVSNAAHELRTPLTPVIGYAGTLRRRPDLDDATRQDLVEAIAAGADRLNVIVNQLVWFADLEAGRAHVAPEPTDLSGLVDATLAQWRDREPHRTFRRRLARDLPQVMADPGWTRRALDEVMANAVKFSQDTIVVGATATADGRVRLEVRDHGIGIPDERMAEVRSEFHQLDASSTRHYAGLGLGLAIVERILDRQAGELDIVSNMGQGTHVALVLRAAP